MEVTSDPEYFALVGCFLLPRDFVCDASVVYQLTTRHVRQREHFCERNLKIKQVISFKLVFWFCVLFKRIIQIKVLSFERYAAIFK